MDRRGRLKGASHGLAPPLYYASFSGLSIEVGALLDQGANVNAEGGEYGNALQAASFKGHNEIVEMLLASGAIFEEQSREDTTAMLYRLLLLKDTIELWRCS